MRRSVVAVLLLMLLIAGLSGCGTDDKSTVDDGVTAPGAVAPSTDVTGTIDSSATADDPADGDSAEDSEPTETDAILKELEAIQRELDETALPDDSDFADIENGL